MTYAYIAAALGIGILGNILVRKAKTRTTKMMILVPSMVAMGLLLALWMQVI